jgi:hypothetical protein
MTEHPVLVQFPGLTAMPPPHARFDEVGLPALGLWVRGLMYAEENQTDGWLTHEVVERLGGNVPLGCRLRDLGFWHEEMGRGYRIHNWSKRKRVPRRSLRVGG